MNTVAIPSYPPRLSPTAAENVRQAQRLSIEVVGTVVDRPRWGIAWTTRDGVRGFAHEDMPEDYHDGAPEGHTPGQGLIALYACPLCALDAIEATGTEALIYVDGTPLTLAAAEAIEAEHMEDGRFADRYEIGVEANGDGISAWYCRDCGHLTDGDDGCPSCGHGRTADARDMEEPMDLEDRLDALLKLED